MCCVCSADVVISVENNPRIRQLIPRHSPADAARIPLTRDMRGSLAERTNLDAM